MTDYTAKRDRWGRPLLIPPGGGERAAYMRASTLAKALDDGSTLARWQRSMVMLGLVRDESLYARVASLLSRDGDRAYEKNRTALREIADQAMSAIGAGQKANKGTSVHEFTEVIDEGRWPEYVPAKLVQPLRAYQVVMVDLGVKVVDTEVFVAVDELKTAGSLDRLVEIDGRVHVADIKTGANEPDYPLGVTTQTAIYSRGKRYNLRTDERSDLWPDGVDQDRGVLIHLPLNPIGGEYRCDLYWVDLARGWEAAQTALDVREIRKIPKLERIS
ncbi:hypothetical protein [Nocardia colli]|uniref:hypothetical protein n=1 Tax=Nocardia colli TaxID=2545717 RepID=UPI0035E240CB